VNRAGLSGFHLFGRAGLAGRSGQRPLGRPSRFAYLPFGAGPRVCIGAQFALNETVLVLPALLRRFRLGAGDAAPVLPVTVLTTVPDHRPAFRLRPR
jgi:cytochrome P450